MKKRTMFLKMITASVLRRRSRMIVALLAIAIGATVLSGLVTIYYDVPRQLGAQFRNYGANMILMPSSDSEPMTMETIDASLSVIPSDKIVGYAPYQYETVLINQLPILAAATDMEGAKATSPYWMVSGEWPSSSGEVMVGKNEAEAFALEVGDTITMEYRPEGSEDGYTEDFTVTGILDTGGNEENYVFISLEDMKNLTHADTDIDVTEVSISATQDELQGYADKMSESNEVVSPRLVKRVTQSESTVLTKLQALVFLVTLIVLLLTMICVATTMMAAATERRKEIGLRKALGASNASIIAEFMGEGLLLGGIGGLIGSGLGFLFAQLVSVNVFNSSITFHILLLPLTILVSIAVTGLSCLLPVRSATDVDPAIVLKGE